MTERLHAPDKSMAELLRRTNSRITHLERQGKRIGAYVVDRLEHDEDNPLLASLFASNAEPTCRVSLPRGRWYLSGFAELRQVDDEPFRAVGGIALLTEGGWPAFDSPTDNLNNMESFELRDSSSWGSFQICTVHSNATFLLDDPREVLWGVGRSSDPSGVDIIIRSAHLIAIPG